MNIDKHTIKAMTRFKKARSNGDFCGTKCIVSMQRAAAAAGLVTIIYNNKNGFIADFELTPAGDKWEPPS